MKTDKEMLRILAMTIVVLLAMFVAVFALTATGCSRTDEQPTMGDADSRFVVVSIQPGDMGLYVIEDSETGVQYLVAWENRIYASSIAVTPILTADGTPYTRENSSTGAEAYMPRRSNGVEKGR